MRAPFLAIVGVLMSAACSSGGDIASDGGGSPALATPASAATLPSVALREDKPGLLARAKITPSQARSLALSRVPGGRVVDAEIEEEDGRLVYSFDLEVEGQEGVMDVEIDAMTGDIIAVEHEDEDDDDDTDDDEDPDERDDQR